MSAPPSEARTAAAGLTDEAIRAWTRRSRAAMGLPPTITDGATLARLLTLAFPSGSASGASHRERGSARANSKGPGLTNRDLCQTTSHTTEKLIGG